MNIIRFIKNWILPLSMIAGVAAYFIVSGIDCLHPYRIQIVGFVGFVQPALIFSMLFLSFCRVDIREMRLRRWHIWLLLVQTASFALLTVVSSILPQDAGCRILIEAAMLCLICPTATAAAVVVKKLGGSAADVATYTILINLSVAVAVPMCVPIVHPQSDFPFFMASLSIMGKVFPLLLCPLVCAVSAKRWMPSLHLRLSGYFNLSFYLWTVALALAIAVTTRSIVHTKLAFPYQAGIALVSLVCCCLQFYIGKRIGRRYGDSITAGQALGQKNTVLAIWMGSTFFSPITSVAGGFYSVWHNLINSYQLYRQRKS